ncbi:MAG: hypothetical protein ACJAZW_003071 [Maritalea sp.]
MFFDHKFIVYENDSGSRYYIGGFPDDNGPIVTFTGRYEPEALFKLGVGPRRDWYPDDHDHLTIQDLSTVGGALDAARFSVMQSWSYLCVIGAHDIFLLFDNTLFSNKSRASR